MLFSLTLAFKMLFLSFFYSIPLQLHPCQSSSVMIISRFCQFYCTPSARRRAISPLSSISHSSIIHSLYAHISNSAWPIPISYKSYSIHRSSFWGNCPCTNFKLDTVCQFLSCSLSPHFNLIHPLHPLGKYPYIHPFTTTPPESIPTNAPTTDDKSKGVVDRSSTVVARDVVERAAAANSGNCPQIPASSSSDFTIRELHHNNIQGVSFGRASGLR